MNTVRFLKYVWPFYNIMHERVKQAILYNVVRRLFITKSISRLVMFWEMNILKIFAKMKFYSIVDVSLGIFQSFLEQLFYRSFMMGYLQLLNLQLDVTNSKVICLCLFLTVCKFYQRELLISLSVLVNHVLIDIMLIWRHSTTQCSCDFYVYIRYIAIFKNGRNCHSYLKLSRKLCPRFYRKTAMQINFQTFELS